ncbi:hypothetical protein QNM99_29125 [Pseudomonas sp. PCH446]
MLKLEDVNLAIAGLVYVGPPLAVEFGKKLLVAGLGFFPVDSKNIADVLAEALSTPELLAKLSSTAVLQSHKNDWESTSKRSGPSCLLWPTAQKKVFTR